MMSGWQLDPNCESPEHEETGLYKGRNGNQSDAGFFIGVHPVWNLCVWREPQAPKNHTVRGLASTTIPDGKRILQY